MPVAVKSGVVIPPDGRPVGVGIRGSHHPVAVGVKVQIRRQFIAGADARGAAHTGSGGGNAVGESGGITAGVGRRGIPAAAQIPANGVQLIQGTDIDEAVVVQIVVNGSLSRGGRRGVKPHPRPGRGGQRDQNGKGNQGGPTGHTHIPAPIPPRSRRGNGGCAAKGNNHNRALLNGKSEFHTKGILTHPGKTRQRTTATGAH